MQTIGRRARLVRRAHFAIHDLIGLTKKYAALAVPEHDVMHK